MKKFENYAATPSNPKWENMISRENALYERNNDIRSEFHRDYTRIINTNSYKRIKHKTQVFFSPENDHICTRIEHVTHVESISYTIAKYLGLNTELTRAIATAHDLGHSPFGHSGEHILSEISKKELNTSFWHEKNGLIFMDNIELLEDQNSCMQNLSLTYAVRDGIISHCGEINENYLKPRDEFIDLNIYNYPNEYAPYTWEGCVVKLADKISYLCRDIQDAITLNILDEDLDILYNLLNLDKNTDSINNTVLTNDLIADLCANSTPETGLHFSPEKLELINKIKEFNYKNIYYSKRIEPSTRYFKLIINEIYNTLKSFYSSDSTMPTVQKHTNIYPNLCNNFLSFLQTYFNFPERNNAKFQNKILFSFTNELDYYYSILLYISGMTDNYAIEIYNEIIHF